jgi:Metallo-beta-lactamase superfamily
VHRLGDDMVNFYLVEDGPELLLVDAGLPRHFPQLTRLLERLGRSLPDINPVLLNRGHLDHLGIAERVRRENGRRSGCTRQMRQLSNARHVQSDTSHTVVLTGDALVTSDGIAGAPARPSSTRASRTTPLKRWTRWRRWRAWTPKLSCPATANRSQAA